MNEYEISKLKKEIQRKNDHLKEAQEENKYISDQLVKAQAEKERFYEQLQIARQTIENVDLVIAENVREMKAKLEQENSGSLNELQSLRDRLMEEKHLNEKMMEENRNKDAVISELSFRLRELYHKHKDPTMLVNTKEISEQVTITHNQFHKLTEKYNRLCADMENILAENKILRKLQGVPENFGFDLEEIKIAEKQELEDYKAQCRKLETEIEELEAERTQLRYRLRQYNTLYSNKSDRFKDLTQRQLELLDTYALNLKEGKVELPQIDKTQKEMEKEIIKLRAQVEVLQNRGQTSIISTKVGQTGNGDQLGKEDLKKLQEQIRSMLEPFVQDIRKLSETNINTFIQNFQTIQPGQPGQQPSYPQTMQPEGQFNPPIPLPLAHNDWSRIKEGYSYKYASKIPIDMKDLEGDIDFNQLKARYEVAALQLQNMESLKMLKEKQDQEKIVRMELQELKEKYKKCLMVQDDLFVRFFKEKDRFKEGIKNIELEKRSITDERDELRAEISVLREAFNALSAKTDLQDKYKSFAERLARSEAGVIKAERKYKIIYDEHISLKDSYTRLERKAAQNEFVLKEKLLTAKKNEKLLVLLTNQVLDETKDSISSDTHNILLSKMETLNDKSASSAFKETQLRLKISRLESVEREMNIKDELIEYLREDKLDLSLELQVLRNRLEALDPDYRAFRVIYDRLVKFMNENSISLISYFKKFDRDNTGTLEKGEFFNSLNTLGFKISRDQFDAMFSEFDLDGSGSLSYVQFSRKLKRSGVVSRSGEDQVIYQFFKAIKHANISVKKAFQIVDMDGSNKISKTEMETALRKIGIDFDSKAIDSIFRSCDSDLDGYITSMELEALYSDMVRDSAIDEIEFQTELDWKYKFVLKVEESCTRNGLPLQDAFKELDDDGSSYITTSELSGFLSKAGVYLEKRKLDELFRFLDSKIDGKVEYSEFLKVLEEAKKEEKRIERLQAVKKRAEELRKENQLQQAREVDRTKSVEDAGFKVRMMALQTKQGNLIKKNEKLCKSLANKEQEIKDLESTLNEHERSIMKVQDEYYKEKERSIILQEKMKNYIGDLEARQLKESSIKTKIENTELQTQLDTYKGMYIALTDKNKAELMSVEKIKAELHKHYDIVKDLQSESITKSDLGKLALELEYSKRNEEIVNKKYEDITEEIRKLNEENKVLSYETVEKEKEIVNAHLLMKEKSNLLQKNIDALTARILPTVTISKIDDFIMKLRQISTSKSQLEEQNKALREKNFSLQIRNDYIENEKVHLDELEKRLRRNYTDDSSVAIIDLTKKLSEYKMGELKAKREFNLVKEKEEYYTRINNANTENIKELEAELGKWEIKFNDREEFWRKRLSDQMKLLEEIQREAQRAKQNEVKAVAYFNEKAKEEETNEEAFIKMSDVRSKKLQQTIGRPIRTSNSAVQDSGKIEELRQEIDELTQELNQKEKEIYNLKVALRELVPEEKLRFSNIGSQIGGFQPSTSFVMQTELTTSHLKNNARRFINNQKEQEAFYREEATKMAEAAQQSIDTLQRIIDDKNEQLKRKDKIISELKKEMLRSKEEDCYEIQKLNEEIRELRSKKEMENLNQIMNKSTNKNFYPAGTDEKVQSLLSLIEQKQTEAKNWETKYNQLFISKSKVKPASEPNKLVEAKLKELEAEREREKKRYADNEAKQREIVKNLEKKIKEKDTKLSQLHNVLVQIKEDVVNEKQSLAHEKIDGNEDLVARMNKGTNPNDSRMEVMLQKAQETIQIMSKRNKEYEAEIKKLREEARMGRTMQRR